VGQEETLLATLLFDHAVPVVSRTTRRRLSGSPQEDREDIESEVTLQLFKRLKKLKDNPAREPIEDFSAYSAFAAHKSCDDYFRQRHPHRHRLRNRLRYLLETESHFAIWQEAERGWVCGPALWRQRPAITPQPTLSSQIAASNRPNVVILNEVFQFAGSPIEFDALVDIFARLWGVKDHAHPLAIEEDSAASNEIPADALIEQAQNMRAVWNEITFLPVTQRAALLLNLRDPSGGSALWLIASSAVSSVRKIAEFLDLPADQFAQLWSRLPLSDLDIAERLGVTRQQVINLRQAARQRLARKMRVSPMAAGAVSAS
jgi:DNA-directed RNA polymerase specialized sigma24 family protein